jgi:hypothetical protein
MDKNDIEEIFFDTSAEGLNRFNDMPSKCVYRLFTLVLNNPEAPKDIAYNFTFP